MPILQRGTLFANHRIGALIATGRTAEVYEATAPDGAVRALKLIKLDVALDAKSQRRLVQEIEIVATLEHVHVVGYHGGGIESGRAYLLMELVRGPNLSQLVASAGGLLSVERAVSIVQQAASGVAAAHLLGFVHRDLEPANILVGPEDLVKVIDFSSAHVGAWGVRTTASETDLTSCLYTSPDYLRLKKAALPNDVYVLGVILHELIAGVHPVSGGSLSPLDIIKGHLLTRPVALATLSTPERPIPDELSDLVLWAMVKDPAKRCSMRELADGLALVLTRLRGARRAAARNLPMPDRSVALAKTEAMAASGPSGTTVMPVMAPPRGEPATRAVSAVMPADTPVPRAATLPPPPSGAVTLAWRPASGLQAAPLLRAPPPAIPPALARALAVGEVDVPGERRSTGAPLVRPAPPPSRRPRAPPAVIAMACAAVVLGLTGAGWLLIGAAGSETARAPPAADRAPSPAAARAPPPAAASAEPVTTAAPVSASPPRDDRASRFKAAVPAKHGVVVGPVLRDGGEHP